jgi:polypeptide N-acetylgalactosaminyltransferase
LCDAQVWSMLLRSIHSIIIRTDWRLISEIIVVDDASTFDELKDTLDRYVALLPVRTVVLRNPSRQGLMRSRVNGARAANGSVIVFMDAHTEANADWLVPILREIESDPMLLAIPHLDTINPYTIK